MPLLKHGRVIGDLWTPLPDDGPLAAYGPILVTAQRWLTERDRLIRRSNPVGVRLANADRLEELAVDIDRFGLIALHFPKFNDGRAYTQATRLRQRYGYRGELRATGDVLRDQLLFMIRAGFDAFELSGDGPVENFIAALKDISVFYQPAADRHPWARQLRFENSGRPR